MITSQKHRLLTIAVVVMLAAGTLTTAISPALGIDLGGVLKGGAIVVLIDKFSGDLNDFINKLTANKGVGVEGRTKVVPIITIGSGTYAGAAQVSGPANLVDTVKAVAQLEANFSGRTFRVKVLVPVATRDITKGIKRISGVGVSAVIDVKL